MSGPGKLATLAALAVVLGLPARARADDRPPERTVAMMSAQVGGDADPALRGQVQEAVRRGLDAAGYDLVDRDQLRDALADAPDLIDCSSSTCLSQISDKAGANRFLRAMVEASGAAYTVELELLDLEGDSLRRLEESCAVCTIVELSELVTKVAEALMTTKAVKPVPVVIVTQPEGARLQVDGRAIGQAPYTGDLAPGEHRVTAHLAGHGEVDRTIEVKAVGKEQRFEIILAPIAGDDRQAPSRPYKLLKFATAGTGVAALATGAVLVWIDGDGTCGSSDTECERRYDTLTGGLASIGLGLVLAGGSAWMFVRDADDARRAAAASIVPLHGGAYASFRLRF